MLIHLACFQALVWAFLTQPSWLVHAACTQATTACTDGETQVLVVGAGMAGLSAGKEMLSRGMEDFIIVESENRIGGRVSSISGFGGSAVLEECASWVYDFSDSGMASPSPSPSPSLPSPSPSTLSPDGTPAPSTPSPAPVDLNPILELAGEYGIENTLQVCTFLVVAENMHDTHK